MQLETLLSISPALLVLILGLVEFAKKLEIAGKTLTILSMVFGILLGVAYQLAQIFPAFFPWLQVAAFGLLCGLAASGIYDFTNARFPSKKG